MHYIYNPGDVYYSYDFKTKKRSRIGEKSEFVKGYVSPRFVHKNNLPIDSPNSYMFNGVVAFNPNDVHCEHKIKVIRYRSPISGNIREERYPYREYSNIGYCYTDGYGRIIDPRDLIEDVVAYKAATSKKKDTVRYSWFYIREKRNRERQWTKSYSGYSLKRIKCHLIRRNMIDYDKIAHDEDIDEILRDYHISIKMRLDRSNPVIDDPYEAYGISKQGMGWKYKHKANKQYNKLKSSVDSRSIRTMNAYEEDYTDDEIDEMLEEDFLKNIA